MSKLLFNTIYANRSLLFFRIYRENSNNSQITEAFSLL